MKDRQGPTRVSRRAWDRSRPPLSPRASLIAAVSVKPVQCERHRYTAWYLLLFLHDQDHPARPPALVVDSKAVPAQRNDPPRRALSRELTDQKRQVISTNASHYTPSPLNTQQARHPRDFPPHRRGRTKHTFFVVLLRRCRHCARSLPPTHSSAIPVVFRYGHTLDTEPQASTVDYILGHR